MYCNKCGKQISDESSFCNFCGSKVKNEEELNDDKGTGIVSIILISFFILITILAVVVCCLQAEKNSNDNLENNKIENHEKHATIDDIYIEYKKIDHVFGTDEYYMVLQVQEKIVDLKLSIDYLSSSGEVLKTEIINVGKVVPGNQYKFELSLSNMYVEDLDRISKFYCRILSGIVDE